MGSRMKFIETKIKGSFIITPDPICDERGFFARTFCRREFEEHGLNSDLVQCNISFNKTKGKLRGMHYQAKPYAEAKLIRCTAGAICDVIIDLRSDSSTFRQWLIVYLSAENHKLFYIPEGFAHGFQTLTDNAELIYHHSTFYNPDYERGLRYDDPALAITWPLPAGVISVRDQCYPLIDDNFKGIET
jgi:dTDP-4-dehydrorhamnose 3,5-epimerase